VEKLRLRELYQGLLPPATAAMEAADDSSATNRAFQ
jgi:hypothetical protein